MTDFYAGCNDGQFEQVATMAGSVIRCTGTLTNVTESELIESLSSSTLSNWLELIFATPNTEEMQTAFMAGCALPLIVYLVSWAYSIVIEFATKD